MEENEEFGVINLINDGIEEPEDVEVEQYKQVNLKRYIKKEAICDNFFFIYSLGIIQSLFSIGCFYIIYLFFELSYILPFLFQFLEIFDGDKNERLLGWKLNDIDFAKISSPLTLLVLWEEIAKSCKNCRFGKLLIKNLSI